MRKETYSVKCPPKLVSAPLWSACRACQQPRCLSLGDQHRRRFWKLYEGHSAVSDEAAMCAAIYLLCADTFLWGKSVMAVKPDFIDFPAIQIHGVDLNGYVLFHTVKDLYKGTKHISLSELTDPELVSDWAFQLII